MFFLINIQFPRGHDFDEFHYVPSAKQFLALKENQNWEHPPLGKELMAVGIGIFGDRPIGWRFMSTVFGALTLVGMYLWGLALFRNRETALWVALLTLFNQFLYVQARIGMLDTFMMAFLVWALAAFTASWRVDLPREKVIRYQAFAGLMFGLATACKWIAVVPLVLCIFLVVMVRVLQGWGMVFSNDSPWKSKFPDFEDWFSPKLWSGMRIGSWVLTLGVIPLAAYFLTFIPFLFVNRVPAYTLWDLVLMQPKMWDGQLRVVTAHPYMSDWTGWPIMKRPIWYAFDREAGERVRGVLLLGNPLIMWMGLAAIVTCLWAWLARRSKQAFLITMTYGALFLCWAVIPRKIAFYYYYYPAAMVLSLALAFVFHYWEPGKKMGQQWARWAFLFSSFVIFVYFFPILAGLKISADTFRRWMWFSSWI